MGSSVDEQFCLRWNDFQQCIKSTFTDLRDEGDFMDVTLSCDGGEQVKAHKVILSACSVTFRALLKKNPAQNPVIVLWDVKPRDLAAILDFMYHGEVNVKQDHLNSFLAVAERLRVRGLCQNDGNPTSSSAKPAGAPHQVEKSKVVVPSFQSSSSQGGAVTEPMAKRPRPSPLTGPAPSGGAAPALETEDDEVEELPHPQVKLELEPAAAEPPPLRRASHYKPEQGHHYPMAEAGYDESMQGSEYGDYSGYEDEMGYMEGGQPIGADHSQGGKEDTYCYECNKTFTATSSFRRHVRDFHTNTERQFQCDFCDKIFKTKGQLINHKSAEHRTQTEVFYLA